MGYIGLLGYGILKIVDVKDSIYIYDFKKWVYSTNKVNK